MKRVIQLLASLLAVVAIAGCTPGRSLSRSELNPQQGPVSYGMLPNNAGPMPIMVGDSLGTAVFTTRKSLVARGHLNERFLYASGESSQP